MSQVIIWNAFVPNDIVGASMRTLGAYRLASWIRSNGYTCQVIEYCNAMSTEDLVEITESFIDNTTICIGVSSSFWLDWKKGVLNTTSRGPGISYASYLEPEWVINARERVQSRHPNLEWALGGAGVLAWTSKKTDYFSWHKFYGQSEDTFTKWLDERAYKKYFAPLRENFNICRASQVFTDTDAIEPQEVLPLEIARGCQFRCKFCRYPLLGKTVGTYIRDPEYIEQELLHNYHNYGTTRYFITDDTINETDQKIIDLAKIAQRLPFELEWVGYTRLDLIGTRPHTVDILRDSGLRSPFFGIETFDRDASKIVGKGWNGKHAQEWLVKLHSIWGKEVNFALGFIIGLGNEDESSIWQSQDWCEKNIRGQWSFQPLTIARDLEENDNVTPSIFDREYHQYGYRFPNPNNRFYWENSLWNWQSALALSKRVNNPETASRQHVSFGYMSAAAGTGYSFKQLMNTTLDAVDWVDISNRFQSRVHRYVEAMRKINATVV